MKAIRRMVAAAASAPFLVLTACQQEEAPVVVGDGDETEAEGEVLDGTISDRMIPYDEIGRGDAPALPALPATASPVPGAAAAAPARNPPASAPAAAPAPDEVEPAPAPAAGPEETAAEDG